LQKFKADATAYERLERAGVKFSATCVETLFEGDVIAGEAVVTNSNKLRAYTTARFFPDKELVDILVSGKIKRTTTPTSKRKKSEQIIQGQGNSSR
jgi:hypothetical protein